MIVLNFKCIKICTFSPMKFLRFLLFPFAIIYGTLVFLRNKFYDWHLFPSSRFEIPIILVGNISTGGTGKSPHIEYLIRLLKPNFKVATLSRGYGRKTKGYILAKQDSSSEEIGDEPKQFKNKFEDILVAVDSDRANGIKQLLSHQPDLGVVLLDDAFQHRALTASLSIVLTDYNKLFSTDLILPVGNLREFRSGVSRAAIIIVTKCPENLSQIKRNELQKTLIRNQTQKVLFSYIQYGSLVNLFDSVNGNNNPVLDSTCDVLLLTGIATTQPLEDYVKGKSKSVLHLKYSDHHSFSKNDLNDVIKKFNTIASANKIILTTEKDAMRLMSREFKQILMPLPVCYLPIEVNFYEKDKITFNQEILNHVR